jgi:polysaccharide biosynthesis/export protein
MKFALLLAVIGTMLVSPSFGQEESLLIGPGDQVHVEVFDTPELSSTSRVNDNGDLPLLMGGSIHVAGLTPTQASDEVEHTLVHRRLMNSPQVLVTVLHTATRNVTVIGQVIRPGAYEITTPRPLTELLAQAGGFTELADHHVSIRRANLKGTEDVFVSDGSNANLAQNVYVSPGDSITIPKQKLVYILGDVNRAGGFPMNNDESGITVLQAVARAGGGTHTAGNHARLMRRVNGDDYKEIPINLSAMQKGKQPDIAMQENDILYVPFDFMKNAALDITAIAAAATSAMIMIK